MGGLFVATVVVALALPGHWPTRMARGGGSAASSAASAEPDRQRVVDELLRQQNDVLTRSLDVKPNVQ